MTSRSVLHTYHASLNISHCCHYRARVASCVRLLRIKQPLTLTRHFSQPTKKGSSQPVSSRFAERALPSELLSHATHSGDVPSLPANMSDSDSDVPLARVNGGKCWNMTSQSIADLIQTTGRAFQVQNLYLDIATKVPIQQTTSANNSPSKLSNRRHTSLSQMRSPQTRRLLARAKLTPVYRSEPGLSTPWMWTRSL